MADSYQQVPPATDLSPRPSLPADIVSDNYNLLLVAALLVLLVTLIVLVGFYFAHYGLSFAPVVGQIAYC